MIRSSIGLHRVAVFLMIGALIQPSTAWSADYTMNAAFPGPYDWGTAANWNPNTGFPNAAADNATVNFSGSGDIDVDLGGGTYTVDTLSVTYSGSGNRYFRDGTLNASAIKYTSGTSTVRFASDLTVDGGTNQLLMQTPQNMWMYFYGPVTGSGGMKFGGNGSVGSIQFSDYQITGDLELAASTDYAYLNFAGSPGGTQTIDTLTYADNDPFIIATGGSSSNKFTLEIAGATTVNSDVTYAKSYSYSGQNQVSYQGPINFLRDGYCQLQLNGTGGGVLNVNGGLTTAGPSQTLSVWSGNGTININAANPWSTRTGTTLIDGGAVCKVNLDAPDVLGSGRVDIRSGGEARINYDAGTLGLPSGGMQFVAPTPTLDSGGGALVYTVEQTIQPVFTVSKFNAIGGYVGTDITSGSPNTSLQEDAVLIDLGPDKIVNNDGSATTLTRASLGISAPTYWKAVDGTHDSYTVGPQATSADDPDNIYKGMAFTGARNPGTYWSTWYGDLNALPGEKLQFVVGSDVRFQPGGTTKTELNAYDANKTVDIYGSGYMYLISSSSETPIGGNWEIINRYGQANSQNYTAITFDRSGLAALEAGKTVNVWDGMARIYDVNAVEGTLSINDGATLYLDRQPTTGTFNINSGGAIWMNYQNRLEGLTLGSTLNVGANAMLLLYTDMNTATNANLNQVMRMTDIVLDNTGADVFSGNGIVLGDGKRLMTSRSYNLSLSSSTVQLAADAGATEVGLASMPSRTLDINCAVNLAGVDLKVGSATDLTTVYGSANPQRYLLAATGSVTLDGNVTCKDLTLESGNLYLRGTTTNAEDVTVNNGILYAQSTTTNAQDLTVNGGAAYAYSTTTNLGNVVVNGGELRICDGTGDTFSAASLTHNVAGTTNFQNGASWNIAGDMTINAGTVQFSHVASTVTSKIVGGDVNINDGAMLLVSANNNAAGSEATLTNAILDGRIAENVVVNDGGQFKYYLSGVALVTGPYYVNQAFTITGDAANSVNNSQIYHDIEGGSGRQVHYNNLTLADGAVFGMNAADGAGRAAVTLSGDAAITNAGDADNFQLLSVASDTAGTARTLTLGQPGSLFTTALGQYESNGTGLVGSDVTLDLVNASLTLGAGGQIDGSIIARSGSTFTVPGGTTTTIGGDLSVLAGSTVNFGGAYVTVAGLMSGDGVITGPVTVSGTGSVGPGTSPGTLTTGSLTLLNNSHLLYELDAPGTGGGSDLISVEGDLDVDDGTVIVDVTGLTDFAYGTYTLITYTGSIFGDASNFSIGTFPSDFTLELIVNDSGGSGGTVQLSSTPEPSTLLLLLLGAAGLFACGRRRRR